MIWSLGQYILDCDGQRDSQNPVCTLSSYNPPPATIEHYSFAPTWAIGVIAFVAIVAIIAIAIIWYERAENNDTWGQRRLEAKKAEFDAKARIAEAHDTCVACGTVYAPKLEDIKT